jgi:hypothetical protein
VAEDALVSYLTAEGLTLDSIFKKLEINVKLGDGESQQSAFVHIPLPWGTNTLFVSIDLIAGKCLSFWGEQLGSFKYS